MTDSGDHPDWAPAPDAIDQQIPVTPEGEDPVLTPQGQNTVIGEADEADLLEQSRSVSGDDDDYPAES